MGYGKKKKVVDKKVSKLKRIGFCLAVLLVVALIVLANIFPLSTWKYNIKKPDVDKRGEGELRVHFLDVGQGDATIVELPDGKIMLIDGGNDTEETETTVLRYLNALDVDEIDYLVVTHADVDHCGGLAKVLEQKKIKRAFLPLVTEDENEAYAKFYASLVKEGCPYSVACPPCTDKPETSLSVVGGNYPYTFAFLYPEHAIVNDVENALIDDNDASIVLWLDYMGTSFLFTGDAPVATEKKLMQADLGGLHARYGVDIKSTEILKVAHHGGADSTSEAFIAHLGVKTAVVSCGENTYGHPSLTVCQNLTTAGATLYRTDSQGHIMVTAYKDGSYETETER